MRQIQAQRILHPRNVSSSESQEELLDPRLFDIEKKASNFRDVIVDSAKLLKLETRTEIEERLIKAEKVYRTTLSRTLFYKETLMTYIPTQLGSTRLCRLWTYLYPLIFDAIVDNMAFEPLHPEKKDCVDKCNDCYTCTLKWISEKLGCPITDIWLSARGILHSTGYYTPEWQTFSVKEVNRMLDFYTHYKEMESYIETQLNWLIKQYKINNGKTFLPFKMPLKCSVDETNMKVKENEQSLQELLYGGPITDYLQSKMDYQMWSPLDCQIEQHFFEQAKKKNPIISREKLDDFLSYQPHFHNIVERIVREPVIKIEPVSSIESCIQEIKEQEREIRVEMYVYSDVLMKEEEENMMLAQELGQPDYE